MLNNRFLIALLFTGVASGTILLTAIVGFALSTVGSYGVKPAPVSPAPIPRLSENLRGELNSAMAPEFPFNFDTVGNPFADTSGVSLAVNREVPVSGTTVTGGNPAPATLNPFPKDGFPKTAPMPTPNYPSGNQSPNPITVMPNNQLPVELLKERQRQAKLGKDVPTLASYYSIDELRPYGVVGSGTSNKVKLFAPATNSRFAVSRGTRFRDGTIESIGDEGVSFRRDNGEVVFNRWMKNKGRAAAGGNNQANAPILRVERPANP